MPSSLDGVFLPQNKTSFTNMHDTVTILGKIKKKIKKENGTLLYHCRLLKVYEGLGYLPYAKSIRY